MNKAVELPSGKILNMDRFIALLPVSTNTPGDYHLILEGYSAPIALEERDGNALKKLLQLDSCIPVNYDRFRGEQTEQLYQNQRAIALLDKRRQGHQAMSREESLHRGELFEEFKQIIDAERLPGQKLYLYS